jgi:hypothetical protein
VAVVASATAAPEPMGQPPAPAAAPAGNSGTLDEVTVTALRAELAPRIRAFVNAISTSQQGESLARWQTPVCPGVTGLPRQEGEVVLEHISDIARAAGVPLADEHCRPNLFVFVTSNPEQLLRAMEKRNRAVTFVKATPLEVDEFIARPQPVKAWYNSYPLTPDYATPPLGSPSLQPCSFAQITGASLPALTICDWGRSSRVTSTLVWAFSDVYVIVDSTRLHAVTSQQLGDYAGMLGLAELKSTARLGDAPTILQLFNGAPQSAPAGVTAWDQAYLKSLYTTEQKSKIQRALIAKGMMREILPQ